MESRKGRRNKEKREEGECSVSIHLLVCAVDDFKELTGFLNRAQGLVYLFLFLSIQSQGCSYSGTPKLLVHIFKPYNYGGGGGDRFFCLSTTLKNVTNNTGKICSLQTEVSEWILFFFTAK